MADKEILDSEQGTVEQKYPFRVLDQFIKDLSFENPNYLNKFSENAKQPQLAVNMETSVGKIDDSHYEVSVIVGVKSEAKDEQMFILELTFASLVAVAENLPQESLEPVLLVHCPFLMFPFIREIVARITASGGYPPLMLDPVDFASLYIEKKKEAEASANAPKN